MAFPARISNRLPGTGWEWGHIRFNGLPLKNRGGTGSAVRAVAVFEFAGG